MIAAMDSPRDCPFCAGDNFDAAVVQDEPRVLAVRCAECGAVGPHSHSPKPQHAIGAWNLRYGRLTLVR
jgi:uncharacterized Zn finger protein